MKGRICMVTGANSGIGKETAAALARMDATVVMVCRNPERGRAARDEIMAGTGSRDIELMIADLSSPESVRELAAAYRRKHDRLHVLINNAGVINGRQERTPEGIDRTVAVNHLGPFLLTHLLLDLLESSAPSRIVNVSSEAHRHRVRPGDLMMKKDLRRKRYWIVSYSTSKLDNLLFTYELARRLAGRGVTVNALHPGWARSDMGTGTGSSWARLVCTVSNLWSKCCEEAAATSVYLASSPDVDGVTGKYFVGCREARSSRRSHDRSLQERLWNESERLLQLNA